MFVLTENGGLVAMKQEEFAKEEEFQRLLEDYPALLAGGLINPEDPRRWLLVSREIPVPSEMGGSGIWSADHLFLDHEGIPTIVEVKRQSDTRIRREVVAQMLDYAANGVAYWTVDILRSRYERTCEEKNINAEAQLLDVIGDGGDVERFWSQVKTNLEAQKIRLLFVADVIPRELRRIVEFLNRQMNPVEVLALELKHYVGENKLRTLAPTLFGQTEESRSIKQGDISRNWNKDSFFQELALRSNSLAVEAAQAILQWMEQNSDSVVYGHGKIDGSITAYLRVGGLKLYPMVLSTQGKAWISFRDCMKPPFEAEEMRREWQRRLNELPDISIPDEKLAKYAVIPLPSIAEAARLNKFLEVMNWFVEQVNNYRGNTV
jgi:hypothetical protein